ncbi:MerR family transcriptional regulator [Psychrobacillus sp. Sa2BUA9]|uniref:MerR family transcriptional regulator n=1 Tax=Psychrobacillus faecigallinarum TaxID=2762235 RepID=A0ABR8RDK3_9BACI|nr:MerR family transcriptional regulator [Psychrobacillus faecigallinarum]MBD7945881.1 MerR family transcriptional regulator [Psychrobacillus faecigallinarum]
MLHINKVAELTGTTVRTLRYYDKINLLSPASKTEGGHRLYNEEKLQKLLQIQFLKKAGFSLEEIKQMLYSNTWSWSTSLKEQLNYVINEQEKLKTIELSLRELINSYEMEREDNAVVLQKLMQLAVTDKESKRMFRESTFSKTDLEQWDQLPHMSSNEEASLEWISLIGLLKDSMSEEPHSPTVQHIILQMEEKRIQEYGQQNDFLDQLWEIRKSEKESEKLGLYPLDQDLLEFLESAYAIYLAKKE